MSSVHVSTSGCLKASRDMLVAVAVFVGIAAVSVMLNGCAGFQAPNAKEQNYTAAIVGCAAKAKTKKEDHACRVQVNHDFGLCSGNPAQLPGDCE